MYLHGIKKNIVNRPKPVGVSSIGLDPILDEIFIRRGITHANQLDRSLNQLPSPWLLQGMQSMVEELHSAFRNQSKIIIVADFDADGATSCAVAYRGLKSLGAANVDYVVPNRFEYGYGLTPEIVRLVVSKGAEVILTVDNGISSIEGVDLAKALGIKVLITDHHLPGAVLPAATAIVNPNVPEDSFPSRNIAGVGVIFYVLMALRIRLREQHWFQHKKISEPNLAQLLDYVALGTVADVVPLDHVNRILVQQGLMRIRSSQCHPGIKALLTQAGKSSETVQASDLGFSVAPRLNAAGRMDDMSLGIQCLLSDSSTEAEPLAAKLDGLNQSRKEIENQMKSEAIQFLQDLQKIDDKSQTSGICLFDEGWHQGVVGILASRIKDRLHRPVIVFAPGDPGEIKGSARSIPGVHIRDVLSEIAAQHPAILNKFGGHAMAAGLTIKLQDYPQFSILFSQVVQEKLEIVDLEQKIYSDGQLDETHMTEEFANQLQQASVWGQTFPEPAFDGVFDVIQCRVVGQQHLKLVLRIPFSTKMIDAIAFFVDKSEMWLGCRKIHAVYKLDINEFRHQRSLQLQLLYAETL